MSEIINKADETKNANELILNNILRSLTLLEFQYIQLETGLSKR
jgi:DNA polymerase III psi subunit